MRHNQWDTRRAKKFRGYFFSKMAPILQKLEQEGVTITNLGAGSPDQAPPPAVIAAMQKNLSDPHYHGYPGYAGIPELKQAIADWYKKTYNIVLDPNTEILPVAGTKQGLALIAWTFIDQGDISLIPDPGFPTYTSVTELAGGSCVYYSVRAEKKFQPELEAVPISSNKNNKILWLNTPHNPTGSTLNKDQLKVCLKFAKDQGFLLVSDSPYTLITQNNQPAPSILEFRKKFPNCLELQSFSKSYNMAGWRLGWITGNAQLIQKLQTMYSNLESGVFKPLQLSGIVALQTESAWIKKLNGEYTQRKKIIMEILQALGCTVKISPATFYLWARIPDIYQSSDEFASKILAKYGIFVTPGSIYGRNGESYIRVACCQTQESLKQALKSVLKKS